jgi:hypothetical protein
MAASSPDLYDSADVFEIEGLLDDVPTIGKVFRGCNLQRRSIDFG